MYYSTTTSKTAIQKQGSAVEIIISERYAIRRCGVGGCGMYYNGKMYRVITVLVIPIQKVVSSPRIIAPSQMTKPYRLEIRAARAKLRELQKQHGGLLEARDLLHAKLRVLPVALKCADEAQRWLVFARATFSRHTRQVLHQQSRLHASFLTLPPPSEWSAPWLQHFSSLRPEEHRFYYCTLGMHIKLVMAQQQQQHSVQVEARIIELMDTNHALIGVLMRLNPLAVMTNSEWPYG